MALKVAINGFGRIGMIAARIIAARSDIELVAVNATMKPDMLEYLLKYDSVHGIFDSVKLIDDKTFQIGKDTVKIFSDRDPKNVDFGSCGAELVIECTGAILSMDLAEAHIKGGVKKVLMSAPAKDDTPTYVYGVNHADYNGETIISNASCTTNCLGPITKILHDAVGIQKGIMTTVHSYTNDQNILDVKHSKDKRRARAAAINIIPTSTGAAKAIGKVIPELNGKLNGYSLRVPTPDVSIVDMSCLLKRSVTKDEINAIFKEASQNGYKGLVEYDEDMRVSSDFIGSTFSAIFVPDSTQVVDGDMVKVVAWYDNEWGYTSRLVDMAKYIGG
ncbi:MAG TPA: type I glyceraldehyde-3-phosphate dehydrogenase [Campylobacterales bacterium]|nr:type I glyceraldehyde-3-phosphate dehydrogenase [Campylobacterales bacterium]